MSQQVNNEKEKEKREELQKWLEEIWGAELESLAPVETEMEDERDDASSQ